MARGIKRHRAKITEIVQRKRQAREEARVDFETDLQQLAAVGAYDKENREQSGFEVVQSTPDGGVKLYKKGDSYVIAHRGTANVQDVGTDYSLLKGDYLKTDSYKERLEATKELMGLVPDDAKVYMTGHSMGGTSSTFALNDKEINRRVEKVVVYNPGSSPFWDSTSEFTGDLKKVKIIRKTTDPVSAWNFPGMRQEVGASKTKILRNISFMVFVAPIPATIWATIKESHTFAS